MAEVERVGPTPLHAAALAGHVEVCKVLLEHGADPMARDKDGDTALHLAVLSDEIDVCRAILGAGATLDFTARNSNGRTALDLARERDSDDIETLLIEAGAPPEEAEPVVPGPALPLVSADAGFLAFEEAPPSDWLLSELEKHKRRIRVPEDVRTLRWSHLPFWGSGHLLAVRDTRRSGPSEQFALVWPNETFVVMDWTNNPIYEAADERSPRFDDSNALLWCRFFFHFVRGQLGQFRIVEDVDQVIWAREPTTTEREEVASQIQPLKLLERSGGDRIVFVATVVFKNALFRTKIMLATKKAVIQVTGDSDPEAFSTGQMSLFGEDLLLEEQPFFVAGPPTRFG